MDKERFTKDTKYRAFMLAWHYWQAQEVKLKADAKEMVEAFNKEIKKQEEQQRKLEMMREHPEWFETTSPKEYGIKLMKKRRNNMIYNKGLYVDNKKLLNAYKVISEIMKDNGLMTDNSWRHVQSWISNKICDQLEEDDILTNKLKT